jgi:uncharacterized membrane protein
MKNGKDYVMPCDKFQIKANMIHKAVWWVIATGVTVTLGLVSVIYANINNKIDSKADKAVVQQMQIELHDLWLMHVREGYKSSISKGN